MKRDKLKKVDWSNMWSVKYPILKKYKEEVDIDKYSSILKDILLDIEKTYKYSKEDTFLVLKDILYNSYMTTIFENKNRG